MEKNIPKIIQKKNQKKSRKKYLNFFLDFLDGRSLYQVLRIAYDFVMIPPYLH